MGIVKKIIENNAEVYIWEIDESENQLKELLPQKFHTALIKIKKQQHRLQWLASRVLLISVLNNKNISFSELLKDKYQKPYLTDCEYNFSISHSGNYAALILSKNNFLGIDLETKLDQTYLLKSKFSSEFELDFISNNPQKSALIWSSKESIYKAYGKKKLIFKEDMQLTNPTTNTFLFSKNNKHLDVQSILAEDYLLTFVNLNITDS